VSEAPAIRQLPLFTSCVQAFEEEFDYLHRAVRRLGVSGSDAEDLVQEVFLVMWRRWSDYQQDRPLRPWMVGIAAHLAHRHKRRRLREVFGSRLETADDGPLAEERLASAAARNLVLRVLGELPSRHRIPLVMHEIEGLTITELTQLLDIPLATAYTRVRRARLAFAAVLQRLQIASTDAPLDPGALLAAEKATPPPAPKETRRRAVERARSALASPPLPPARPAWPVGPVAAAVAVVGLVAVGAVRMRDGAGPAPRASAAPAASSGLVGYWRFDERGAWARDLSPSRNDCQMREFIRDDGWIPGARGGALELGPARTLECDRPAVPLEPGTAMTAAAWIRPLQLRKYHGAIVSQQLGDDWAHHFLLGVISDDLVVASDAWDVYLRAPLRSNVDWVHVAFTRDATGRVRLFAGGRLIGQAAPGNKPIAGRTGRLIVGSTRVDPDWTHVRQLFYGAIDELMIFNRAVGDAEIAALASAPQVHAQLP